MTDFGESVPGGEGADTNVARRPSRDQPRGIHRAFTHEALREFALHDPLRYLQLLASAEAKQLVEVVYSAVCERLSQQGEQPDFGPAQILVHLRRVNGHPVGVIEMPPPEAAGEAYFTALVGYVDPGQPVDPAQGIAARYFTLEMAEAIGGEPQTTLKEWTQTGTDRNHGPGPEPTLPRFILSLQRFDAEG